MVGRRHVYHLAGYDLADFGTQYRRFARELDTFKQTWNLDATLSDLERSNKQSRAWWTVRARGINWKVEAVQEVFAWDDIVRQDMAQPLPMRVLKSARAYLEFIATGTMFRYVVASPRYALFFLFPLVVLAAFAAGAGLFGRALTLLLGLDGIGSAAVGSLAAVVAFV